MSNQDEYFIEPLNVLSFPKGKAPVCELTGYPATCKLSSPDITLVSYSPPLCPRFVIPID